jgi:hypothetical protein
MASYGELPNPLPIPAASESGRNHKETCAGCIVSLTTPTRSSLRASRSVSLRSVAERISRVFLAIEKSGNKEAAEMFDSFNEEPQKPEPKKSVLRTHTRKLGQSRQDCHHASPQAVHISTLFA